MSTKLPYSCRCGLDGCDECFINGLRRERHKREVGQRKESFWRNRYVIGVAVLKEIRNLKNYPALSDSSAQILRALELLVRTAVEKNSKRKEE